MFSRVSHLSKSVAIFIMIAAIVGGGVGMVAAQNDNHKHSSEKPVWQEVERPIKLNPDKPAPQEIIEQLVSLKVTYRDMDKQQRQGIIEVNRSLKDDVLTFFKYAYYLNFPVNEVVVSSDPRYKWDDNKLMAANATSGFNYRTISGGTTPSQHGLGRAIDVNPRQNPYITLDEQGTPLTAPKDASWLPGTPGTLHDKQPLIQLMESRGWSWGGRWTLQDEDGAVIDYQHLQKRAPVNSSAQAVKSE